MRTQPGTGTLAISLRGMGMDDRGDTGTVVGLRQGVSKGGTAGGAVSILKCHFSNTLSNVEIHIIKETILSIWWKFPYLRRRSLYWNGYRVLDKARPGVGESVDMDDDSNSRLGAQMRLMANDSYFRFYHDNKLNTTFLQPSKSEWVSW